MPAVPTRDLKVAKIIDKTFGVLELGAVPTLVFVIVVTAASVPISYYSVGSLDPLRLAGGELLKTLISTICGYFLLIAMMRRTGLRSETGPDVLLPYLAMSILASLAVLLGLLVIVLPGLFLMTRWSIAQPFMVAQASGVMASLGESWERTRGNEVSIFLAALAMVLLPAVVVIAAGVYFEQGDLLGIGLSQLAGTAISAVLLAMGTALYGLIVGGQTVATAPA